LPMRTPRPPLILERRSGQKGLVPKGGDT
jgi:hypothetical protein